MGARAAPEAMTFPSGNPAAYRIGASVIQAAVDPAWWVEGAANRHRSLKRVSKAILDTTSIKQEPPGRLYRAGVSMGSSIQTPHSILETRPPSKQGPADDARLLRCVSMSVIDLQMTSSVEPIYQWDLPPREWVRHHQLCSLDWMR